MPFNPWEAMGYAVRSAHVVGPTKAAAIRLADDLVQPSSWPNRGKNSLACVASLSADRSHKIYTISKSGLGTTADVFWLPWGQNEIVQIKTLNESRAEFFLTSEFSGCYFIGCDGMVMHTAAGYKQDTGNNPAVTALKEMVEIGEDLDLDTSSSYVLSPGGGYKDASAFYGSKGEANRAVVLGWRSPTKDQWFFAYQDLTIGTTQFGVWRPLVA
jgi:hypothetical protein